MAISKSEEVLIRRQEKRQEVLELLVDGPMSVYDIALATGARPCSAGVRMAKMVEQGNVWNKDGTFGLTEYGLAKVPDSVLCGKIVNTKPRTPVKIYDERQGKAYRRLEEGHSQESAAKESGYKTVESMMDGAKEYSRRLLGARRKFNPHQYNKKVKGTDEVL